MIIGIRGQVSSGKDTSAYFLQKRLTELTNKEWFIKAFAKPVKRTFCDLFDVDESFIEHWKRIPEPPPGFNMNVRDCLILIGDGFRKMQDELWINKTMKAIHGDTNVIILDSRYDDEANAIIKRGGKILLLFRPDQESKINNPSEQQLMKYVKIFLDNKIEGKNPGLDVPIDYFILNNGTLTDLYGKLDRYVVKDIIYSIKNVYSYS